MSYPYLPTPSLADTVARASTASNKYESIKDQITEFQDKLDSDHEIAVQLASFGSYIVMNVTDIGFQNPDLIYFYGFVNGRESQLIQHMTQLNFLMMSVEREDKTKPARRIGF